MYVATFLEIKRLESEVIFCANPPSLLPLCLVAMTSQHTAGKDASKALEAHMPSNH